MKRIIAAVLSLSSFLVSCEIDNYAGPNASFYGGIRDSVTGELVETDIIDGSIIRAVELGFETPAVQTWAIKNTGEFRNNFVFAGRYDFEFSNGNFYPFKVEDFEITPGDNQHDFKVVPYIRIKDLSIRHDAGSKKIIATFSLEGGKPEVAVKAIRLYAFTDMYVGEQTKFSTKGSDFKQTFAPAKTIDDTLYTLSIDLEENAGIFKYHRNYYFRVGALASVQGVGTVRYNYAPLAVIPL